MTSTILFLNENPLPKRFTNGTIAGKELRLRAAIPAVKAIHVLSPIGKSVTVADKKRGPLERKVVIHPLWPCPYYFRAVPLAIQGYLLTRRLKPQLIEAESPIISGPAAIIVGAITGSKVFIEMRASYEELIKLHAKILPYRLKKILLYQVMRFSLTRATAIIANSNTYAHYLLHRFSVNSTVINPGLQNLSQKTTALRQSSVLTIGFLGRLVPEKGVHLLLQAALLLKKARSPRFNIEIAGDGPQKNTLQQYVTKHHLSATFLGFTPAKTVLARWDMLVNPCLVNHPLEMANAEAASVGVPVICFGNSTLPETVVHQQTGIKVRTKTAAALAKAIKTLLTHTRLRTQLSRQGPTFARSHYGFTKQVKTLTTLYHHHRVI